MRTGRRAHACLAAVGILILSLACRSRESRAVVTYVAVPGLPSAELSLTVDDGVSVRAYRGGELRPQGAALSTPAVETAESGTLRVGYELTEGGATVSKGDVQMPLRKDWSWEVTIRVDSLNPSRYCFGCSGATAFPLAAQFRRVPADSVWVTWGGNSISNPVIY